MMNTNTPAIQGLARRLIALESDREPSAAPIVAAVRTCDRLRATLARLVGIAGFCSLMSRALALAGRSPLLDAARVLPDGSLGGLDGVGQDSDAGLIVVSQLLGLLLTFIGEPLTPRLVNDAWPDAPVAGIDAGSGEGS